MLNKLMVLDDNNMCRKEMPSTTKKHQLIEDIPVSYQNNLLFVMLISCNNLFMSCITGCITDYNIYTKGVPLIEVLNYTRLHGIRAILILLQFKKKCHISSVCFSQNRVSSRGVQWPLNLPLSHLPPLLLFLLLPQLLCLIRFPPHPHLQLFFMLTILRITFLKFLISPIILFGKLCFLTSFIAIKFKIISMVLHLVLHRHLQTQMVMLLLILHILSGNKLTTLFYLGYMQLFLLKSLNKC